MFFLDVTQLLNLLGINLIIDLCNICGVVERSGERCERGRPTDKEILPSQVTPHRTYLLVHKRVLCREPDNMI